MSDRAYDAAFDAAAEALIMLDPAHPESVAELVARFSAVCDLFGEVGEAHPARQALVCANRLAAGEMDAVAEIERAYAAARALGERTPEAPPTPAEKPAPGPAAAAAPVPSPMPLAGDEELLRDFGVRAAEHLDDADEQLLALESDPCSAPAVDAVFRSFHTIKGMAGFLALDAISEHAHASESLLAEVRRDEAPVEQETIQSLFVAVDRMRALVLGATGMGDVPIPSDDDATAESDPQGVAGVTTSSREGTVRVEEQRLDGLLDTIGEMVIAESMVSASLRNSVDPAAIAIQLDRLDKITRELQQMATSLRMVPLRATFRRMSRLVRDVAHKAGKPVDFVVFGDETELDKEVVDRIADPLVHALRNAVDHGIESPEERRAAGKPEAGRIELHAFHAGGAIHIEVRDDGRGIDPARVLDRARERGLIDAEATLDDADAMALVFEPGFSTAEKVTDVSGRGVGMDVVRRTVDELRGRIEMDSRVGEGTTVSIRLPLTLAIIDGMVVRVADERYIIPMISIERSVRPAAADLTTVQGRGEMLSLPEGPVPLLRLHRLFDSPGATEDPTEGVVVITSEGGSRCGLMVCELMGQQQTVIKPLGKGLADHQGITGGAIMPDGRVGLILDAAGLIRLAHRRPTE